jgi:predicted DNA-binding antitoxin AbrB/MazE fold protein
MIRLIKTIKARYKNGVIEPVETLEIPDDTEITVTIDITSFLPDKIEEDWRRWRGMLAGTSALRNHEREHREEVKGFWQHP